MKRGPVRAWRRQPVRAPVIPSAAARRERGPRPPDHVIEALLAALAADTHDAGGPARVDAEPRPVRGARWLAALRDAPAAIVRAARRGVLGALSGAGRALERAREARDPVITDAPRLAGVRTMAGAARAISEWVLSWHTRVIEALARAAGAHGYIWTTMRDALVRPLHVKLEDTIQLWDAPPLAGLPNFHGHPGTAAGPCRCQAFPIIISVARRRGA